MLEHEKRYWCIPPNSVKYTNNILRCAFCPVMNPEPKHLSTHSIRSKCCDKSYTRKENLTKHLDKEHHGVDASEILETQSKCTVKKKYYACGFCVSVFESFKEQMKHVDGHFIASQRREDWDRNKEIRGLLSQQEVAGSWRTFLGKRPEVQESSLSWDPTQIPWLKHELEMSQKPGVDLCNAAIISLRPEMQTSLLTPQYQNALSSLPSTPGQGFTAHDKSTPAPILGYQDWDTVLKDAPPPQSAPWTYGPHINAVQHQAHFGPQPHFLPNSGGSYMQQQLPASVPSFPLPGHTSHVRQSQPRSSYSSRDMIGPHNSPVEAPTGWSQPPLLSSYNGQTSPSGQFTSPYSPKYQPYSAARPSRPEATGYPGINTDIDTGNVPWFTPDPDYSAGQGGSH